MGGRGRGGHQQIWGARWVAWQSHFEGLDTETSQQMQAWGALSTINIALQASGAVGGFITILIIKSLTFPRSSVFSPRPPWGPWKQRYLKRRKRANLWKCLKGCSKDFSCVYFSYTNPFRPTGHALKISDCETLKMENRPTAACFLSLGSVYLALQNVFVRARRCPHFLGGRYCPCTRRKCRLKDTADLTCPKGALCCEVRHQLFCGLSSSLS